MPRPKKIRLILAVAIVLAGVSLIVTVILKFEQRKSPPRPAPLPHDVEMAMRKAHYSEVKDGAKKWDLFADQAFFDMKNDVFHLNGVSLVLAAKAGVGTISVTADRADYYSKTKDVHLAGNVVARSDSGLHFFSARARYIADRAVITTSDPVTFVDGRIQVKGIGMEFHTATRDLKILKDVTADIESGHSK
jgi:LPS export ABC transporter protein LptC